MAKKGKTGCCFTALILGHPLVVVQAGTGHWSPDTAAAAAGTDNEFYNTQITAQCFDNKLEMDKHFIVPTNTKYFQQQPAPALHPQFREDRGYGQKSYIYYFTE